VRLLLDTHVLLWAAGLPERLPVTGAHAVAVDGLPAIHRDPFDRLLVAQAMIEGVLLLTADPLVARYPGPVRLV
jgi:PIN domain nuclease of toxin-antitoxin system